MAREDAVLAVYRSWGEYREALAALPPSASVVGGGYHDRDWALGLDKVGDALALSDKGWPEGMDKARSIIAPALEAHAVAHVQHSTALYADVTGAGLDVGGYLSGEPECWHSPGALRVKPTLTLAVNLSSSAGVPAENLILRGAGLVALTVALQNAGYVVRVNSVEGGTFNRQDGKPGSVEVWTSVTLTDDNGGPLDMDRLVYALAHPSASRTLGYCMEAHHAGYKADRIQNIGWIGWPEGGRDAPPPADWKHDLYIPGLFLSDADWQSPASVQAWIEREYARLTNLQNTPEGA